MILEIATIEVLAGKEAELETGVDKARALFNRAKGCRGISLRKGVESPSTYLLMIEWETLENHMVDFRLSDDFQLWRSLVGHCFASPPSVSHSEDVILQN
jgi:heme-degrading monooxygenase HmoA